MLVPLTADNRMINYSGIWKKNFWDIYIIPDKKEQDEWWRMEI